MRQVPGQFILILTSSHVANPTAQGRFLRGRRRRERVGPWCLSMTAASTIRRWLSHHRAARRWTWAGSLRENLNFCWQRGARRRYQRLHRTSDERTIFLKFYGNQQTPDASQERPYWSVGASLAAGNVCNRWIHSMEAGCGSVDTPAASRLISTLTLDRRLAMVATFHASGSFRDRCRNGNRAVVKPTALTSRH